jgi:hypothetical protein
MDQLPHKSAEYYRYLEQDERFLAALSTSEEAKQAHLQFADEYRKLAQTEDPAGMASPKAA